jgi:hypothetical protein
MQHYVLDVDSTSNQLRGAVVDCSGRDAASRPPAVNVRYDIDGSLHRWEPFTA